MSARSSAALEQIGLARGYALLIGVILVVTGIAGFFQNPIVGDPAANPLVVTGTVHDMIHLATGFLAIYIAFAMMGRAQADALTALGILYLVLVIVTILSPNLFGILGPSPGYNVNLLGQVLHIAVGLATVAVGVISRRRLSSD